MSRLLIPAAGAITIAFFFIEYVVPYINSISKVLSPLK